MERDGQANKAKKGRNCRTAIGWSADPYTILGFSSVLADGEPRQKQGTSMSKICVDVVDSCEANAEAQLRQQSKKTAIGK